MEPLFLPEGARLETPENRRALAGAEGLEAARLEGRILEGLVKSCDPQHNLVVDLGPFEGFIPRLEAAVGLDTGETREIAVLSRVGKPVCFQVMSAPDREGRVQLSRRLVQERTLDALMEVCPGDVLRAKVTHLEPFGAFVDVGNGVVSFVSIENISVSRIYHPCNRFFVGQEIRVVVKEKDLKSRRLLLTHKELLGTWEENAAEFRPGETVTGVIRGIESYGVFVELRPNLSGLAEVREGLRDNQRVSVFIKSILPATMKIKLLVIDTLPPAEPEKLSYYYQGSHLDRWDYCPAACHTKQISTVFGDL